MRKASKKLGISKDLIETVTKDRSQANFSQQSPIQLMQGGNRFGTKRTRSRPAPSESETAATESPAQTSQICKPISLSLTLFQKPYPLCLTLKSFSTKWEVKLWKEDLFIYLWGWKSRNCDKNEKQKLAIHARWWMMTFVGTLTLPPTFPRGNLKRIFSVLVFANVLYR